MRCGRSGRHNDKDQCPALSSICDKCGKLGHYARICQSSSNKPAKVSTVRFANPLTTAAQFHQPPSIHCLDDVVLRHSLPVFTGLGRCPIVSWDFVGAVSIFGPDALPVVHR